MLEKQQKLNSVLKSFNLDASCVNHEKIRNISLYDLVLNPGTRVKEIQKFSDEISLSMMSKTKPFIRIISEKGIVRLELVDESPHKIDFYEELNTLDNKDLNMYLGSSTDGEDVCVDMSKNPHLLIAGTTGSGKSNLINIIIANALNSKKNKIFLIDSKNIEFTNYRKLDTVSMASDYKTALNLLKFVYEQMEYRYECMSKKDFSSSGKVFDPILFIVDEFADIIMQDTSKEFFTLLCKIAQKSRAASIHCVVATQRPSVDILKGSIKANFPARISCQVAAGVDSKVILDAPGAELLAGNGDAIIKNYNNNFKRFQIAFATSEEIYEKNIKSNGVRTRVSI